MAEYRAMVVHYLHSITTLDHRAIDAKEKVGPVYYDWSEKVQSSDLLFFSTHMIV